MSRTNTYMFLSLKLKLKCHYHSAYLWYPQVIMFICETTINVSLPLEWQSTMKKCHAMQRHCDFFLVLLQSAIILHGTVDTKQLKSPTQEPIGKFTASFL